MCWKVPLQRRAKIAGVMDMLLSTTGIIVSTVDINNFDDPPVDTDDVILERNRTLILIYTTIAISVIKFIMGFTLWSGAKSRNDKLCLQWFYVSLGLWVTQIIIFTIKVTSGSFVLLSTASHALVILIRIIVMFVVYRFIEELHSEDNQFLLKLNSTV